MKRVRVGLVISMTLVGVAVARPDVTAPVPPATMETATAVPPTPPIESTAPPAVPLLVQTQEPPPIRHGAELELSATTALWLSLGGTLGSYALIVAGEALADGPGDLDYDNAGITVGVIGIVGTFAGPSFGHWYAGKFLTRGLGVRVAGIGIAFVGAARVLGCHSCDGFDPLGSGLMLGAAAVYLAGTVDDIIQAPKRVHRINAQRALAIVPRVSRDSVGFVLSSQF